MRFCIFCALLISRGFVVAGSPAADEKTVTVVAEGVGKDEKEARKAAFRDAVSKVVGTLIDAETLVKNDEVISEKILEYSGGFIKTYDTLKTEATDGLVRVRIKAVVERTQIIGKLSDSKVSSKEVRGTDLLAEKTTKEEARKNATELLAKLFADLPKLMQAEVVGKPKLDKSGNSVVVDTVIGVNQKAYGEFVKKAVPILGKVALAKATETVHATPLPRVPDVLGYPANAFKKSMEGNLPRGWAIWVATLVDAKFERTRWDMFWVDADLAGVTASLRGQTRVRIVLEGGEKETIDEGVLFLDTLASASSGGSWYFQKHYELIGQRRKESSERGTILISPYVLLPEGYKVAVPKLSKQTVLHAILPHINHQFMFKLNDDKLERVKGVTSVVELKP